MNWSIRSFIHTLSIQHPKGWQRHTARTGTANRRGREEWFSWLQPPSCHQVFALGVQRLDQFADLGIGLARDTRGIQRLDLIGRPADGARPQADGFGPQTLRNAQVDSGAGVAGFRLDGRKPKDGLQHVGTSLGVVKHAAIGKWLGGYPASCLIKRASSLGFDLLQASPVLLYCV